MPRNLAGRILEAAGIAEPPPQGHPEGMPSGPTFQTRRGINIKRQGSLCCRSTAPWGSAGHGSSAVVGVGVLSHTHRGTQ